MSTFSVVLLTAVPTHLGAQGVGAFVKIDGRECLLRTVELFLNRDNVKQIHLAVTPESMEESKRKYGAHLGFSGVKLIAGGPNWIDQIAAACLLAPGPARSTDERGSRVLGRCESAPVIVVKWVRVV